MVTRRDLDGTGSPEGLVTRILKAEPALKYPVPIESLAHQLGIIEIGELETDAFEGCLYALEDKQKGFILLNKASKGGRRRFTIGHELGHLCIPAHRPIKADRFLCSREDLRTWTASEQDAYARMEVEANRFSALLLMPPPLLRPYLARLGDPDLGHVLQIHEDFEVSKDAAARAFAQYNDAPIAVAVVHDGIVQRVYRHPKFPKMSVQTKEKVPEGSRYWRSAATGRNPTELGEVAAGQWLESEWGKRLPELYEQILRQQMGYALVMLWPELAEEDDEYDPDENRNSKQRLADRMSRRSF
jgi:Zn-dependent peptidase ImmA (M78 family)